MFHSKLSPAASPRKTQMPSGMVALRDFDFGRAIEVFDLRLMPFSMSAALFISTYGLAEEFIYGFLHYAICAKRMATQILTRKQRGDMIAPEDIEQINPSSFFVKSQRGRGGYSVTKAGQSWACDCFDHKFRGIKCKHIHAVESQASKLPFNPAQRFVLGLWEAPK